MERWKLEEIQGKLRSMTETDSKATLLTEASNGWGGMKLPRDLYSSKFSYLIRFHRIASLICAIYLLLAVAVTLLLFVKTVSEDVQVMSVLFYVSVPVVMLVTVAFITHRVDLPTAAKVALLKETIIQRPAVSSELWDVIAAHMNEFFCANGLTSLPFYYDGNDCHDHFKSMFIDSTAPFPTEPSSGISENQQNATIGNNANREIRSTIATIRNNANREIRSIIDEAVRLYDQSVDDHWRQQLGEASSQLPEYPGP